MKEKTAITMSPKFSGINFLIKVILSNPMTLRTCGSLRADSTDSLKRSEVPPPVESAHQRYKASLLISAQAYFDLIGVF